MSSSDNSCALRPISARLHLFSLATVRAATMLGHFLRHYAFQGVVLSTNAHLVLHEDFAPPRVVARAISVCADHGVADVSIQPSTNSTELEFFKLSRLNHLLAALPSDAWLIFSDVDELMSYPCDALAQLAASAKRHSHDAMCGFMHDRLAASFTIPPVVAGTPIQQQFPLCPKDALRGYKPKAPIHANPLKITLIKARINGHAPAYLNAHKACAGAFLIGGTPQTNNHCLFNGRFSHYTWTSEAHDLGTRRIADKEYSDVYVQSARLSVPCNASDAASSLRCLAPRWRGKLAGDRDLPCPDGCNWTACALAPAESPPGPPPAVVRLPAERPIAEKSSRCTLGDGFWMPAS